MNYKNDKILESETAIMKKVKCLRKTMACEDKTAVTF
jgi:hypothetical protein